jgi:hypothetical protein
MGDKRRYYIAGPMTKYASANYNFPAFFVAEGLLNMLGHEVVNPARMDLEAGLVQWSEFEQRLVQVPGFTMHDAMRRDITAIADCDGVVLIDDWESSKGAAQELHVARDIFGLPIYKLIRTFHRLTSGQETEGWPILEEMK